MSIFYKLHGGSKGSGRGRTLVTVKSFLGKEEGPSYSNSEKFLNYGKSLREHEIEQLEQFFGFVKEEVQIIGSLITRQDKGNRKYQHPEFNLMNSKQGVKIIVEAGMADFIKDYQKGKIYIDFTLEELIEEAMND